MNNPIFIYSLGAAAPQAGQADYSQQWAEYYRSMGMVKEAEAIEMRVRYVQLNMYNFRKRYNIFVNSLVKTMQCFVY